MIGCSGPLPLARTSRLEAGAELIGHCCEVFSGLLARPRK